MPRAKREQLFDMPVRVREARGLAGVSARREVGRDVGSRMGNIDHERRIAALDFVQLHGPHQCATRPARMMRPARIAPIR